MMHNETETARVYSLDDLSQTMGDLATEAEAAVMRDLLIVAGLLEWTNDNDGGYLAGHITERVWMGFLDAAIAAAEAEADDDNDEEY